MMGDAISTGLGDGAIQPQAGSSDLLATLLMGTLIGAAVYLLSFRLAVLVTAVVLAAYALLAILLGASGFLADPIYTPVAIVLAAGFSLAARYVLVERERRKVERIFGHWVDPRIAQKLPSSRSAEDIISKGERRDITLLFVHIRGLTAAAGGISAEDV